LCSFGAFFPLLVSCTNKNLATLSPRGVLWYYWGTFTPSRYQGVNSLYSSQERIKLWGYSPPEANFPSPWGKTLTPTGEANKLKNWSPFCAAQEPGARRGFGLVVLPAGSQQDHGGRPEGQEPAQDGYHRLVRSVSAGIRLALDVDSLTKSCQHRFSKTTYLHSRLTS
jgi:hypothetical protein